MSGPGGEPRKLDAADAATRYGDGAASPDVTGPLAEAKVAGSAAAAGAATDYSASGTTEGKLLAGRYRLLEPIGEGGMGSVYLAEQLTPVRRKVALKLIKPGMDSHAVLARFEAERQALAMMDHPGIARVFDGGLTEAGRPFFVMEHVEGTPITDYCDRARLDVDARLALFTEVCRAVQHAHQKGIIHRDLKPSNILVAEFDGKPVPKVIDFGLAKAMHQPLTEKTLHTARAAVLGTPLYMSPEQASSDNADVDTRSDVYSLGVLLYELLTGTTPLERKRFKEAAWEEVRRIIQDEEPPKPSTRLSSIDALPSAAAVRSAEPAGLTKRVRGELDWIVMKALEKDRARRYDTPNGFARDVERYLAGEPVTAAPPGAGYRLRKFARRHRTALALASGFVLLLLAGIAGTTWGLIEANAAAKDAVDARNKEKERADGEAKAKDAAERRLAQLAKGNEIVSSIFTALDIRKMKEAGEPLEAALAQRLRAAARQLEGEAVGDPLTTATLQDRLGDSLRALGFAEDALPLHEKALAVREAERGKDHPETLQSLNGLATAHRDLGRSESALPLFEEGLRRARTTLGMSHPATILFMDNLAVTYEQNGQAARALPIAEETLELARKHLGENHPDTLTCMNNLATTAAATGKLDRAVALWEETRRRVEASEGLFHPDTFSSMNNLAVGYERAGRTAEALALYEETLRRKRLRLGADHPNTLLAVNNLANGYLGAGKLEQALPLFEETLPRAKKILGENHPGTLMTMQNLADAYAQKGRAAQARELREEALRRWKASAGEDHPDTLRSKGFVASSLFGAGEFDKAATLYAETLAGREKALGLDHSETLGSLANLATALLALERPGGAKDASRQSARAAAERTLRASLAAREKDAKSEEWSRHHARALLGASLLAQGKRAEAEPLLGAGFEGMKKVAGDRNGERMERLGQMAELFAILYEAAGYRVPALKWRKEFAATRSGK